MREVRIKVLDKNEKVDFITKAMAVAPDRISDDMINEAARREVRDQLNIPLDRIIVISEDEYTELEKKANTSTVGTSFSEAHIKADQAIEDMVANLLTSPRTFYYTFTAVGLPKYPVRMVIADTPEFLSDEEFNSSLILAVNTGLMRVMAVAERSTEQDYIRLFKGLTKDEKDFFEKNFSKEVRSIAASLGKGKKGAPERFCYIEIKMPDGSGKRAKIATNLDEDLLPQEQFNLHTIGSAVQKFGVTPDDVTIISEEEYESAPSESVAFSKEVLDVLENFTYKKNVKKVLQDVLNDLPEGMTQQYFSVKVEGIGLFPLVIGTEEAPKGLPPILLELFLRSTLTKKFETDIDDIQPLTENEFLNINRDLTTEKLDRFAKHFEKIMTFSNIVPGTNKTGPGRYLTFKKDIDIA